MSLARMLFKALICISLCPLFVWAYVDDIKSVKTSDTTSTWIRQAETDRVTITYTDELAVVYEYFSYSNLWLDNHAKDALETQINIISLAGLNSIFERRAVVLRELRESGDEQAYDMFATDSLLALMGYINKIPKYGKSWLFGTDITTVLPPPNQIQLNNLLMAVASNQLYNFVDNLRPKTPQYRKMANAIVALQNIEPKYGQLFTQRGVIHLGDELEDANSLITNLERQGVLSVSDAQRLKNEQVGFFNAVLVIAVKKFQQRHGLKVDGVIGRKTRYWLNKSIDKRIQILALNMERLRLWPTGRDHILLVNIPNYEMELWIDQQLLLDSKVVVGRPNRRTPLFTSRLDSVVFNPSWNVPTKIMRKDILPKQRQDRDYLAKNKYTVLTSWVNGSVIPHENIDWAAVTPKNFPYRLQQSPGDFNALGRYKFNTPNKDAIYLHDTPAKGLFNQERRAFSSGCIRVQKAEILADILLKRSGLSMDDYEYYRKIPKTKWVSLREKINVHTIYQTAWVSDDGEVQFRDDVYGYDSRPKQLVRSSSSLTAHNNKLL